MKRCAFTGYRPQKLPFGFDERSEMYWRFRKALRETVEQLIGEGYGRFLSGGALGMDMVAAETVLELREEYPGVELEMVIPFEGQCDRWAPGHIARYKRILRSADMVTRTGRIYTPDCYFRRNRYLVNNADLLLAAYDGQPGGTHMTVAYAAEWGIPVRRFWPFNGTGARKCAV